MKRKCSSYSTKLKLTIISIWLGITSSESNASGFNSVQCLAETMYHEGRGTTQQELRLIAQVVLNRQKPGDTLCGVVYSRNQFSWTKNHKPHRVPQHYTQLAATVLDQGWAVKDFDATHFHNTRVRPRWKLRLLLTTKYHHYYGPR